MRFYANPHPGHHFEASTFTQDLCSEVRGNTLISITTFRKRLGENAWGVWMALTQLRHHDGLVWPSYGWIGRKAGQFIKKTLSTRMVEHAIARLRRVGLIENLGHRRVMHTRLKIEVTAFMRVVYGSFARARNGFKCISIPQQCFINIFEYLYPLGGDRKSPRAMLDPKKCMNIEKRKFRYYCRQVTPKKISQKSDRGLKNTPYSNNRGEFLGPTPSGAPKAPPPGFSPKNSAAFGPPSAEGIFGKARRGRKLKLSDIEQIYDIASHLRRSPARRDEPMTRFDTERTETGQLSIVDKTDDEPIFTGKGGRWRVVVNRLDELDRRFPGVVPPMPSKLIPRMSTPDLPFFVKGQSPVWRARQFAMLYTSWMKHSKGITVTRYKRSISKVKEFDKIVKLTDALIEYDLSPVEWLKFCEMFWAEYGPPARRDKPCSLYFILCVAKVKKYFKWVIRLYRETSYTPVISHPAVNDIMERRAQISYEVLYRKINSAKELQQICDKWLPPEYLKETIDMMSCYIVESMDKMNDRFRNGEWIW